MTGKSTSDLIRSGAAQAAAGKELDSNTIGGDTNSESLGVSVDEGNFTTAGESEEIDLLPSDEAHEQDSSSDKSQEQASSSDKSGKTSSKEVITVTDETGRRRKVEIDYSDRKSIRKAHEMMHGARKWQAERDSAKSELSKVNADVAELKSNWNTLEKAFQERGEEGVIDLLAGRPGAYKQHIAKQLEKAKFLENASPEELEVFQAREASSLQSKELERIRKENEEFRQKMASEKEAAELSAIESRVHPVFEKYRFADKLGDANDEHLFDEMLWTSAMKRLEPYEDQGLQITPELIDREFRSVAMALRKRIGVQAEKKAAKVIEQKKQEATENVQSSVRAGYKSSSTANEARDLINNGNITSLLKGWGKYGSLFNK